MPDRLSRRTFLRHCATVWAGWSLLPLRTAARPLRQADIRLVHLIVRPSRTTTATSVLEGGAMGAEEAAYNADLFGTIVEHEQVVVDAVSEVAAAAREAASRADAVVAHMEEADALRAAVDAARANDCLLFNAGCRDDVLRGADCDAHLFHIEASDGQYADALAQWAVETSEMRRVVPVVDDAAPGWDRARQPLTDGGVTVDSAVPVADAVSVRDADAETVWIHAAGDALLAAVDAVSGTSAQVVSPFLNPDVQDRVTGPVLWHASLFKYGATQVSDRFAARTDQPMDGAAYANWAAMQIVANALLQVDGSGAESLRTYLRTQLRFDGRKAAPLSFRPWNHQARHELYVIQPEGDGTSVIGSVPARMPEAPDARRIALDALGRSAEAAGCSL